MTDLNEIMSNPIVRVKVVAFVHFLFIANAMFSFWVRQDSYLFYNSLFMLSLFWTMHSKDSVDAIQTAVVIDACSILLDIVCIIVYVGSMNGWAVAFTIINLIVRPISVLLLYKEYTYRGGAPMTPSTVYPGPQQRSYEDIDRPTQTIPTNSSQTAPNVASIF